MTTKNELRLGTLYHATPAKNVSQIMSHGIKPLGWLTTTREDAFTIVADLYDYSKGTSYNKIESAGSIKVFRVNLPGDWELMKGPSDEYISDKTIPPKYLRILQ